MWQTIGFVLAGTTALIGALASLLAMTRSVPAGSVGIVFRFHKPISAQWPDESGKLEWGYRYVLPGEILWWMLPGVHSLKFVPAYERNTDDVTIALQRTDGSVWLTRIILTYNLTYEGIGWAICQAPENFSFQVSSFFHDLVGDVLVIATDDGREMLRKRILEEATDNLNLMHYGVQAQRITIPELSQAPMTQVTTVLATIFKQGGTVLPYGDAVKAVCETLRSESRPSTIA